MADLEIKYRPKNWTPRASMKLKKPWGKYKRGAILEVVGEDNIKSLLREEAEILPEKIRVDTTQGPEKELEKIEKKHAI